MNGGAGATTNQDDDKNDRLTPTTNQDDDKNDRLPLTRDRAPCGGRRTPAEDAKHTVRNPCRCLHVR